MTCEANLERPVVLTCLDNPGHPPRLSLPGLAGRAALTTRSATQPRLGHTREACDEDVDVGDQRHRPRLGVQRHGLGQPECRSGETAGSRQIAQPKKIQALPVPEWARAPGASTQTTSPRSDDLVNATHAGLFLKQSGAVAPQGDTKAEQITPPWIRTRSCPRGSTCGGSPAAAPPAPLATATGSAASGRIARPAPPRCPRALS